jgi:hypothetical protein
MARNDAAMRLVEEAMGAATAYERPDLYEQLEQTKARLSDPTVRVVVVGEFEQGKSELVNGLERLLGRQARDHVHRHGAVHEGDHRVVEGAPAVRQQGPHLPFDRLEAKESTMALRDKLRATVQPYIQPGEQIHAVFLAQTGPSPYRVAAIGFLGTMLLRPRHFIVVSTSRAHTILTASPWRPTAATGVAGELLRATPIGPLSGVWATSMLLGEKTYIHRRFHDDVADADARRGVPGLPQAPRNVGR